MKIKSYNVELTEQEISDLRKFTDEEFGAKEIDMEMDIVSNIFENLKNTTKAKLELEKNIMACRDYLMQVKGSEKINIEHCFELLGLDKTGYWKI